MKYVIAILVMFICSKHTKTNTIDKVEPKPYVLTATVYNPTESQCDSTPLITACNSKINLKKLRKKQIKWVALSRDLLKRWGGQIEYGDSIYVLSGSKKGWWIVKDTMHKRYKNRIDFLTYNEKYFKEEIRILVKK
jgi:3D (Asp-Asp-Asp) domain-containing protein